MMRNKCYCKKVKERGFIIKSGKNVIYYDFFVRKIQQLSSFFSTFTKYIEENFPL